MGDAGGHQRESLLRIFRPAEVDLALAGDGGDEGWIEFAAESAHFGDSELEGGGHVLAGHIAGGEDELADSMLLESALFEQVVADAFVSGEQSPAFGADERQPSVVGNSSSEMG